MGPSRAPASPPDRGDRIADAPHDQAARSALRWCRRLVDTQPTEGAGPVVDRLRQVCLAVPAGLELSGAVVVLQAGEDTETVAASSDPASVAAVDLEHSLGEGPSRDALARGRPVLVGDLEESGSVWVDYARAAGALGVRAVFSFPLQVGAARFGALTMWAGSVQRLDRTRTERCLAMAEIATETLLASSGGVSSSRLDPALEDVLDLRVEVFQAQGMVMVTLRTDLATALARMRAHAYQTDRSLHEVSLDILAGRVVLTDERSD